MSIITRLIGAKKASLYHLITPRSHEVLGPWASEFPAYTEVVGYSSLGHLLLRDPVVKDYAVLHPFKSAAKSYGSYASIAEFEKSILCEAGFVDYVLRREHVQAVAKRLGHLKAEEVYIPQPYPILGGSDVPETYGKGNVWVFASIVAQTVGLQ
jgi:hypothetical protein